MHTPKKGNEGLQKNKGEEWEEERKEENNGHPNTHARCISKERHTARAQERALLSFKSETLLGSTFALRPWAPQPPAHNTPPVTSLATAASPPFDRHRHHMHNHPMKGGGHDDDEEIWKEKQARKKGGIVALAFQFVSRETRVGEERESLFFEGFSFVIFRGVARAQRALF
jgi:hypothetical protein